MKNLLDGAYMGAVRKLKSDEERFKAFEPSALTLHSKADKMLSTASLFFEELNLEVDRMDMEINSAGFVLNIHCRGNGSFGHMTREMASKNVAIYQKQLETYAEARYCAIDPYAESDEDPHHYGHTIHDAKIIMKS